MSWKALATGFTAALLLTHAGWGAWVRRGKESSSDEHASSPERTPRSPAWRSAQRDAHDEFRCRRPTDALWRWDVYLATPDLAPADRAAALVEKAEFVRGLGQSTRALLEAAEAAGPDEETQATIDTFLILLGLEERRAEDVVRRCRKFLHEPAARVPYSLYMAQALALLGRGEEGMRLGLHARDALDVPRPFCGFSRREAHHAWIEDQLETIARLGGLSYVREPYAAHRVVRRQHGPSWAETSAELLGAGMLSVLAALFLRRPGFAAWSWFRSRLWVRSPWRATILPIIAYPTSVVAFALSYRVPGPNRWAGDAEDVLGWIVLPVAPLLEELALGFSESAAWFDPGWTAWWAVALTIHLAVVVSWTGSFCAARLPSESA